MRVIIRSNEVNFNIPIPMCIVNMGIRISVFVGKQYGKQQCKKKFYNKNKDDEDLDAKKYNDIIKYIDIIDYKMLITAMNELKRYKGLNLVEVQDKDGTYVLIRI